MWKEHLHKQYQVENFQILSKFLATSPVEQNFSGKKRSNWGNEKNYFTEAFSGPCKLLKWKAQQKAVNHCCKALHIRYIRISYPRLYFM